MKFSRFFAAFAVLLVIAAPAPVFAGASEALHDLFEDYWANGMEESPFSATSSGNDEYNDRVPGVAPADHARRTATAAAFLERLDAIDPAGLDKADRLSADLLRFILGHDVALAEFKTWRTPFLADTGFHSNFGYVVGATKFRKEKDYEDYIARLGAYPSYIDQNIENMRQGLVDGFTQPKEILPFIMPSFEAQVKENAGDHPFYAPFAKMPKTISKRRRKSLEREGRAALEDGVIPAYQRLLTFMGEEYLPNARDTLGASELPNGEAYYAARVRYYTSLDDATADDIHKLGLKEVARIRREMKAVIKEVKFDGSFEEFLEFLRTDEQFYAKTEDELLRYASWVAKDIDGKLPAFFGKLPRQPYSVEPVPAEIAQNYTTGRYIGAALDADRGGQYWVNTYDLKTRPLYQIPALTLHEAMPGHHLQSALSAEIEGVPEFRKDFYPHAFGEGWGLYSEKLGQDMDVYQTPYEEFGRLSYEMWRACRLVIDTGIHAQGWTRQQALDYLASNTALSLHNVQTEVDRYIAWPGQALAYKMGELTIIELREKAKKELGDKFDIRDYHDAVLAEGGLPLEMLRDRIDEYIAEAKEE